VLSDGCGGARDREDGHTGQVGQEQRVRGIHAADAMARAAASGRATPSAHESPAAHTAAGLCFKASWRFQFFVISSLPRQVKSGSTV
jgi:hypothetical protein